MVLITDYIERLKPLSIYDKTITIFYIKLIKIINKI